MMIAGNFEEQPKAFRELMISLLLALALVYMVLASQYESFLDPLVVMYPCLSPSSVFYWFCSSRKPP